jgi:hypothetical protein
VTIGSAGRNQTKLFGKALVATLSDPVVLGMNALQPNQSVTDKVGNQLIPADRCRVPDHGDTAGAAHQPDGLFGRE